MCFYLCVKSKIYKQVLNAEAFEVISLSFWEIELFDSLKIDFTFLS